MNEETFQQILQYFHELNKKTDEIKIYMNEQLTELKQVIRAEVGNLEKKYEEFNTKYKQLEKTSRKNNIIFNLEYQESDLLQYTISIFKKRLKINLIESDINKIFTIGKKEKINPLL